MPDSVPTVDDSHGQTVTGVRTTPSVADLEEAYSLVPPRELVLLGPDSADRSATLRLHWSPPPAGAPPGGMADFYAFKVKCTRRRAFRIRPAFGLIDRRCDKGPVEITVTKLASPPGAPKPTGRPRRDRVTVVLAHYPKAADAPRQPMALWHRLCAHRPDESDCAKLCVTVRCAESAETARGSLALSEAPAADGKATPPPKPAEPPAPQSVTASASASTLAKAPAASGGAAKDDRADSEGSSDEEDVSDESSSAAMSDVHVEPDGKA